MEDLLLRILVGVVFGFLGATLYMRLRDRRRGRARLEDLDRRIAERFKRQGIMVAALLVVPTLAFAQAPSPQCDFPATGNPMNPTTVCFEVSTDHATIQGYALDILDDQGTVVQTIDMGKPSATTTGDGSIWSVWNGLNVMPRPFGTYTSVARAYGGGVSGPNSDPSNEWDRAPGRPGGPRVVWHFDEQRDHWMGRAVLSD